MWEWEDDMCRCEDVKMWRWEDDWQTPTIRRTLRSDALGKKWQEEATNYELLWTCQEHISFTTSKIGSLADVQASKAGCMVWQKSHYISPKSLKRRKSSFWGRCSSVFITGHQHSINRPLSPLGSCWYFEVDVLLMFQLPCIVFRYFDPNSDGTRPIYLSMLYHALRTCESAFQLQTFNNFLMLANLERVKDHGINKNLR